MVAKRGKGVTAKVPFPQRINVHKSLRPVTRSRTAGCMIPILQRDTLEEVLKFLTPRELTGCASVCSAWRDVALSAALWKTRCEVGLLKNRCTCTCIVRVGSALPACLTDSLPALQELWHGKVYVPARQLVLAGSMTYAQAYVQSLRHAASQHITIPELCGFRWLFRCGSRVSTELLCSECLMRRTAVKPTSGALTLSVVPAQVQAQRWRIFR